MQKLEHNSEKFGYIDLETLEGVQTALSALGFDPGKIDGKDGPNTQKAVREYQARNNLSIDGIVGPNTRASIYNELDKAERASRSAAAS